MPENKTSFPARRAAAERNREKILTAARAAFDDPEQEISMAEISRRAGIGMATLYRNFPGRLELLEALYNEEVDALCLAAENPGPQTPGAALIAWLGRFFEFVPSKRLMIAELLEHTDRGNPVLRANRARVLSAGQPLLSAAQAAHEIRDDLTLEQILDMIVAISKIHHDPGYTQPMFQILLDGLRSPA